MGRARRAVEDVGLTGAVLDPDFWRGRRVFLTGHTGFKGAWMLCVLDALGAEVTGYALAPPTEPSMFAAMDLAGRCRSIGNDVRDAAALETAMAVARPQSVIHMAAQPLVRGSYADPVDTWATNVTGTVNLLDACRRVEGIGSVVVVTTDKCYENDGRASGYAEDAPLGGHDPYSSSKAAAEIAVAAWRRSFLADAGIRVASARAGNVIGGGDFARDRLVPDAVRAFAAGGPLVIRHPDAVRPWQHVLEPVCGYLRLAEVLDQDPATASAFNFGPAADDCVPVGTVADRLAAAWGGGAAWRHLPGDHPHEAALLSLDAGKARRELGWRPLLPLDEAIRWTADWYRTFHDGGDVATLTARQIDAYGDLR